MEILANFKEAQHLFSEHSTLCIESIWPLVFQSFNAFTTDLQGLFQISSFESSLFLNLDWVYKICRLLTALTDVAAVGFRRRPCKLLFLTDGPLEELCTVFECFLYCGFVDAVFTNIDEARRLEAIQNGFGCGFTNGRVRGLEGREVDELALSVRAQQSVSHDTYGNGKVVGAHRCSNCRSAHDLEVVFR
jgi:hypothetical protein